MLRIPQNLCERAIGMLNTGMTMNAFAMNIGFSTCAIRHLRQSFRGKGHTKDQPRSGRQHGTMRGQDRFILNTHLRNRLQTATATAANTNGTHITC